MVKNSLPKLTTAQIINMSVGFFGIQFAFGLQNANTSSIFQTLGAEIDQIPILWIAAPVTGLILQPIIGHLSDKTWIGKLGRRRPYFMIGAIFAALALVIFPNVHSLWIAAIMLWVLDAAINISMEPFRAFVGDMLPDEQRTSGFAMQSVFIGLGAVISSALPYILTQFGVANTAPLGIIPDSIRISYYIGAIVYLVAVIYTVVTTNEYSKDQLINFGVLSKEESSNFHIKTTNTKFFKSGILFLFIGITLSLILYYYNILNTTPLEKELYVITGIIALYGIMQILAGLFNRSNKINGLVEIVDDLNHLPKTMKKLGWVQFFTWFGLFGMWIYSTPALAQHLYNTTDTSSVEYGDIRNWVGVMFAAYNGFAALSAIFLPYIARKLGRPKTHLVALLFGALGLISYFFFKDERLLLVSMLGIGFAWASILAMPYAMLTKSLPANKMGIYMGIFNFFIVIPQILAATVLGIITKHLFEGNAIYAILLGGVSMLIAALLNLRINENDLNQ